MRKIVALIVVGAAVLVSGWLIGSKVAQSRRNVSYQKAMAQFQRDLPIGTTKEDVRKYLDSRNIQYYAATRDQNRVVAFEITIGEDPGGVMCEPWDVYVALEFNSADILRQIHIKRSGTCL
ncbi:MAG: hypothetical protein WBV55_11320 [Candidatus Sulfotelmatobacter sp.]